MYSKVFLGAALLGAASALPQGSRLSGPPPSGPEGAPSGPPPWAFGEERLADFDDLQAVPDIGIQPTGEYKDLYYQGFATFGGGIELPLGVEAHSSPNAIASGIAQDLLDGPPVIYADYADSKTKDFGLKSLYYGCSLYTIETAASVPVACTIKATAYDEKDIPIASQDFEYNPNALSDKMEKVEFGQGFKHVKKVEFDTTATADELVATLFDDISYEIYKKNPFEELHH